MFGELVTFTVLLKIRRFGIKLIILSFFSARPQDQRINHASNTINSTCEHHNKNDFRHADTHSTVSF